MDKVASCDLLILQFPIWWLGPPAVLKGWIDRVFAVGRAHGGGRWFDGGWFAGKRAMCSLTTGGPAEVYSDIGIYAPVEQILFPIHRGILGFTGFTVLEPFVVYGPNRLGGEKRLAELERYRLRLLNIETSPVIAALRSSEYEGHVLKPAART